MASHILKRFSVLDSRLVLGTILAILLLAGVSLFLRTSSVNYAGETAVSDSAMRSEACRHISANLIKPERVDLTFLTQLSAFCYDQVRSEDLLQDFNMRKLAYVQQSSDTRVILWMVVAITISGVLFAGLQLLAAYRLATVGKVDFHQGQGGAIKIDSKSISLKSSVTGLLILIISLAFFIVYVKWVYPIQQEADPEAGSSRTSAAGTLLPGPPPKPEQAIPSTETPNNTTKAPATSTKIEH